MKNLSNEINSLKILLDQALEKLRNVNDLNFDENLNAAKTLMENYNLLKLQLKNTYPIEQLVSYNILLVDITKQIQETFDNLYTDRKNKFAEVGKQIAILKNKAKLTNYYR